MTCLPAPRRRAGRHPARARGAAYVEAIVLIFFLIIIFGGVIYLGRYFEAQQRALGIARRCAWAYSWNACEIDAECGTAGHRECLPAVCNGVVGDTDREPNLALRQKIDAAQTEAQNSNGNQIDPGENQNNQDLRAGVSRHMGPLLEMVVGQSVTAIARSAIERPSSLPNAESSIGVRYYLPCNLRHEDPIPMAIDLFKDVLGGAAL